MIRLADIKIDTEQPPKINEKDVSELLDRVKAGDPEAVADYEANYRTLGHFRITNRTRGAELLGVRSVLNGNLVLFTLGPGQAQDVWQSGGALLKFRLPPQIPHHDPPVLVQNRSNATYVEAFLTHTGASTTHEQLIFPAGGGGSAHTYWMNTDEILFLIPLALSPFISRGQIPFGLRMLL